MDKPSVLPIKLLPSNLRPIAYRIISKKHGLNIQTEALAKLTEVIGHKFGSDWKGSESQHLLEEIAKLWKIQDRGLFVDAEGLTQVIKEIFNREKSTKSKTNQSNIIASTSTGNVPDFSSTSRNDSPETPVLQNSNNITFSDYFKIIDSYEQPTYKYNFSRRQFDFIASSRKILNPNTLKENMSYFIDRYYLLYHRLYRNENFQRSTFASSFSITGSISSSSHEITLIKNLLGRDGQRFLLFGFLSKDNAGFWTLQDQTDRIKLDLGQTLPTEGSYYTPGMFLICDGIYSNSGKFYVSNIGHPPAERRDASLENYGNIDFLGINSAISTSTQMSRIDKSLRRKLQSLEKELIHNKFIFMGSDCFLDDLKVFDGLKKFFTKIQTSLEENMEHLPLAIVFPGSFVSKPFHPTSTSTTTISNSASYKNNFDSLATLLEKFPLICEKVKFIFLPGNNDAWQSSYSVGSASIWPQNRIPKVFCNRLERVVKDCEWLSNPSRISYLSQEIVICRDDLGHKMKRNSIVFPAEKEETETSNKENEEPIDINKELNIDTIANEKEKASVDVIETRKLVKTILDQGTLQPFSIDLKPVNYAFAHALRIEPIPSVIILNDSSTTRFDVTYNGCKVINTGRLIHGRRLNYVEYTPHNKRGEFKEVYF